MVANKANLTTNFNENFRHFFFTKGSLYFDKIYAKKNKASIFLQILKCHFWP